jgi:hypothetical protein
MLQGDAAGGMLSGVSPDSQGIPGTMFGAAGVVDGNARRALGFPHDLLTPNIRIRSHP